MASFLIKRTVKTSKIIKVVKVKDNSYEFKPKTGSVKKLIVTDPLIIQKILVVKFSNAIDKLAKKIYYFINIGETDDTDSGILLGEISRLRGILLNKYQKYLNKMQEEYFLEQLRMLELQLRGSQFNFNYHDEYIQEERRSRGGK